MEYCRRHYGIRRKTLLRCGAVFGVNFPTFGVHPPFASLQCLQLTLASSRSAPGSAPLCFPRTQHHCTHPELLKTFPASSFFFFTFFLYFFFFNSFPLLFVHLLFISPLDVTAAFPAGKATATKWPTGSHFVGAGSGCGQLRAPLPPSARSHRGSMGLKGLSETQHFPLGSPACARHILAQSSALPLYKG